MNPVATSDAAFRGGACPTPEYTIAYTGNYTTSADANGERVCTTPEQFKAWSQNLGHERVMTTLTSYGTVAPHRQAELIRGMGAASKLAATVDPALVAQVVAVMQNLPGNGAGGLGG